MEYLPKGYSYEVVSEADSDSDCQMIRIKEVSCVDSAKVCVKIIVWR